jgi:hypothetical protein
VDADNYVAPTGRGTFVVVVGGQVVGEFLGQEDAERAYNVARGLSAPAPAPPASFGAVTLDCSRGQGAPVNGGCWCCLDGTWDTDPKYCRDPVWAARCGNDAGRGSGQPAPQPGAPVSPGSSLGPADPRQATPPSGSGGVAGIAQQLGTTPRGLLVAGGILAAALLLR